MTIPSLFNANGEGIVFFDKRRSDRLQSRHSFPEEKRSKKHRRQRFKISADRNSLNGQLYKGGGDAQLTQSGISRMIADLKKSGTELNRTCASQHGTITL